MVTITGADDNTNRHDLYEISEVYPFVEWGVLWYPEKMGGSRYPTKGWIAEFMVNKPKKVKTSLHICGKDAIRFCSECRFESNQPESEIWDYASRFNRIQLNFPFKEIGMHQVLGMIYGLLYVKDNFVTELPGRTLILQNNCGNRKLTTLVENETGIEFLFDESRGGGKLIETYPDAIRNKRNGYAGGINPNNVEDIASRIHNTVPIRGKYWIDMESGVRTNDQFDLEKVRSVLETLIHAHVGL